MKLFLYGHGYRYAAEQMLLTLFPGERPEYPAEAPEGDRAELYLYKGAERYTAVCRLFLEDARYLGKAAVGVSALSGELMRAKYLQRIIKLSFYRAALKSGLEKPVWGSLTGIRPGKLLSNLLETGMRNKAALSAFMRDYGVSPDRARLCLYTAGAGLDCARSLRTNDVCLYIGIPFCPTRCAYCSFVSQAVRKSMRLIPEYLAALDRELAATAQVMCGLGLRPVSVYMGGGTPTVLSAEQLDFLCGRLSEAFDLSAVREYTVEAGRPDTITAEKLTVLKRRGVTRVSVNPQTMDDSVLEAIGRKHTARDVLDALARVAEAGGFQVNMDLIAGLPLDTPEGFGRTLDAVLRLSPENITVHTLALKKGSELMLGGTERPAPAAVGKMLDYANAALFTAGYAPYYLYRQKYMSGGFENVGWQRDSTESLYNICIMEELCSVISLGGGASTKLCCGGGRIERIFNPKYPAEYIGSIEKVISDKNKISGLLAKCGDAEKR
ncbi:MAG: coproporphyrinogen dehydrogenase HemZ [Oscillospiraceae bacterium]|jgi:oxygen-independent coproporphyrinogen-3 oxidase|nr:coproporphyrinogen dehydrogenase HemZ [Oscillospiraceae bacterium]